mmetsp:Transcript_1978/g.4346  ORF Transcript_1978/g.4346 Transcript_1978/m.4346 type:complete len:238 (+) Transcript_1978:1426-2139(+)
MLRACFQKAVPSRRPPDRALCELHTIRDGNRHAFRQFLRDRVVWQLANVTLIMRNRRRRDLKPNNAIRRLVSLRKIVLRDVSRHVVQHAKRKMIENKHIRVLAVLYLGAQRKPKRVDLITIGGLAAHNKRHIVHVKSHTIFVLDALLQLTYVLRLQLNVFREHLARFLREHLDLKFGGSHHLARQDLPEIPVLRLGLLHEIAFEIRHRVEAERHFIHRRNQPICKHLQRVSFLIIHG